MSIARERVGKQVSVEMDSWTPARYGETRRYGIWAIYKHFLGYAIERCFLHWSDLTLYNRKPRWSTVIIEADEFRQETEIDQN
jgi:hypothetical protein